MGGNRFKTTAKTIALLMGAILSFIIYHFAVTASAAGRAARDGAVLIEAYRATGAEFNKIDVQGWARLNNRFVEQGEMLRNIKFIYTRLGVDAQKINTRVQKNDNYLSVTSSGPLGTRTYLTVIIQTLRESNSQEKGATYLIVGFSDFDTPENIYLLRNKIMEVFSPVKSEAHYSTIISGRLAKKIGAAEMQKLTKKVMRKAGAEVVESYADARMVSVTGYSPGISDLLTEGGKRVNINMAARYNSEDNSTYIHIGSPIITIEY